MIVVWMNKELLQYNSFTSQLNHGTEQCLYLQKNEVVAPRTRIVLERQHCGLEKIYVFKCCFKCAGKKTPFVSQKNTSQSVFITLRKNITSLSGMKLEVIKITKLYYIEETPKIAWDIVGTKTLIACSIVPRINSTCLLLCSAQQGLYMSRKEFSKIQSQIPQLIDPMRWKEIESMMSAEYQKNQMWMAFKNTAPHSKIDECH